MKLRPLESKRSGLQKKMLGASKLIELDLKQMDHLSDCDDYEDEPDFDVGFEVE